MAIYKALKAGLATAMLREGLSNKNKPLHPLQGSTFGQLSLPAPATSRSRSQGPYFGRLLPSHYTLDLIHPSPSKPCFQLTLHPRSRGWVLCSTPEAPCRSENHRILEQTKKV